MKISREGIQTITRKGTGKKTIQANLSQPLALVRAIDLEKEADRWLAENDKPVDIMTADVLDRVAPLEPAKIKQAHGGKNPELLSSTEQDYEASERAEEELIVSWEDLSVEQQEAILSPTCRWNEPESTATASPWSGIEQALYALLRSEKGDKYGRVSDKATHHNLHMIGLQSKPVRQLNPSWYAKPEARADVAAWVQEINERLPAETHTHALLEIERVKARLEALWALAQQGGLSDKQENQIAGLEDRLSELDSQAELIAAYRALSAALVGSEEEQTEEYIADGARKRRKANLGELGAFYHNAAEEGLEDSGSHSRQLTRANRQAYTAELASSHIEIDIIDDRPSPPLVCRKVGSVALYEAKRVQHEARLVLLSELAYTRSLVALHSTLTTISHITKDVVTCD